MWNSKLVSRVLVLLLAAGCGVKNSAQDASPTAEAAGGRTGVAAPATRSEVETILDAVIADILSNPHLEGSRDFYGTPGDKKLALSLNSNIPWPAGYEPAVKGYEFTYVRVPEDYDPLMARMLGLTVHNFEFPPNPEARKRTVYDYPIEVGILNLGGRKNGHAPGGCLVHYSLKKVGETWQIECEGALDP
jgi:hypothetical protein